VLKSHHPDVDIGSSKFLFLGFTNKKLIRMQSLEAEHKGMNRSCLCIFMHVHARFLRYLCILENLDRTKEGETLSQVLFPVSKS